MQLEVDHARERFARLRERAGPEARGEQVHRQRQITEALLAAVDFEELAERAAQVESQCAGQAEARARRRAECAAFSQATHVGEQLGEMELGAARANHREDRSDAAAREVARHEAQLMEALERAQEHVARARGAAEHEREAFVRELGVEPALAREIGFEDPPARLGDQRHHLGQACGEPRRVDLRGLGRQHRREQLQQTQAQRADPVDQLVGLTAERRELREAQRVAQQRELALGQEARIRGESPRERDLPAPERPELVEEDPRIHALCS